LHFGTFLWREIPLEVAITKSLFTMMYCALALLLAPAAALVAPAAQSRRVQTITHAFVGATSPMGYFDPLQFSKDKSDETISKYREHELK